MKIFKCLFFLLFAAFCFGNDVCLSAEEINLNNCSTTYISFDNSISCPQTNLDTQCSFNTDPTVWYTFKVPESGFGIVVDSLDEDSYGVIVEGCSTLSIIHECFDSLTFIPLKEDSTYFMAIANPQQGIHSLQIKLLVSPPGDNPCEPFQFTGQTFVENTCCAYGFNSNPLLDFPNTVCNTSFDDHAVWTQYFPEENEEAIELSYVGPKASIEVYTIESIGNNDPCTSATFGEAIVSSCNMSNSILHIPICDPSHSIIIKIATKAGDCGIFSLDIQSYFTCNYADVCEEASADLDPITNPDGFNAANYECIDGCLELACSESVVSDCGFSNIPTVWYRVEVDSNARQIYVNVRNNGSWDPVFSIFEGSCPNNLNQVSTNSTPGCNTSWNDPSQINQQINQDVLWIAVGARDYEHGESPEFELCILTTRSLIVCLGDGSCTPDADFEVIQRSQDPNGEYNLPLNGPYCEGETVTICGDFFYDSSETGSDWLHGIIPYFGPGWDLMTFDPETTNIQGNGMLGQWFDDGIPYLHENISNLCTYTDLYGKLQICNGLCSPCNNCEPGMSIGDTLPGGWFWTSTPGLTLGCTNDPNNPSGSWGIGSVTADIHFCLDLKVREFINEEDWLQNKSLVFGFQSFSDGVSGCWQDPLAECLLDESQQVIYETLDFELFSDSLMCPRNDTSEVILNRLEGSFSFTGSENCKNATFTGNLNLDIYKSDTLFLQRQVFFGNNTYSLLLPDGEFTIKTSIENSISTISVTPQEFEVSLINGNIVIQDFTFEAEEEVGLDLQIIPLDLVRPGFEHTQKLKIKNTGNSLSSGYIFLYYPTSVLSIVSFNGPLINEVEEGFFFYYEDLCPHETRNYTITYIANNPLDDPPLLGGMVLTFESIVFNDNNEEIQNYKLSETVRNAFDPNTKICHSADSLISLPEGQHIDYTIHFENLGNGEASIVRIHDDIDTLVFDINTFFITDASSEVVTYKYASKVECIFPNINLGFEPENNRGFLSFRIKTKPGLGYGNILENSAKIYFDFNSPIVTDIARTLLLEDNDLDGFHNLIDCDESDSNVNPQAIELAYNGIDDDCNEATLDDDLDQDGFGIDMDCDDANSAINPSVAEVPYNGIDEDCNEATLDDDLDQDGFGIDMDCDDSNSAINPSMAEVPYNGIDEDCNEATLDDDLDQDGFGIDMDCDDTNPTINPEIQEVPYNGIDDDCNEATLDDDLDQDGFGLDMDCDDLNSAINPGIEEIAYNGIDDDCNETTLDDDLDQDGFILVEDCDDFNAEINPDAEDVPNNGIDENCDGMDATSSSSDLSGVTFALFPNPTISILTIRYQSFESYDFKLFNIAGLQLDVIIHDGKCDLSNLEEGTYLLKITEKTTGKNLVKRVIKLN